jgi:hypothetical protein
VAPQLSRALSRPGALTPAPDGLRVHEPSFARATAGRDCRLPASAPAATMRDAIYAANMYLAPHRPARRVSVEGFRDGRDGQDRA